jgi:hypothetical protein
MILKLTKQEVQLIISLAQKIIIATEQQEKKEKAQNSNLIDVLIAVKLGGTTVCLVVKYL